MKMGCLDTVQIVLIILKLVGAISWSWWWVLSPAILVLIVVLLGDSVK